MKTYIYMSSWGSAQLVFLTSSVVGVEWAASCLGLFIPWERVPCTHWIGSWVGLRTGVDDVEKRNVSPLPELHLIFIIMQAVISNNNKFGYKTWFVLEC
jgi:hypothetical protein